MHGTAQVGIGVWWRFLTISEEGQRMYLGSKREVGLKEEIGLGHKVPRKSQLLSPGSGETLIVLEEGSDTVQQLAQNERVHNRFNKGEQMPIQT